MPLKRWYAGGFHIKRLDLGGFLSNWEASNMGLASRYLSEQIRLFFNVLAASAVLRSRTTTASKFCQEKGEQCHFLETPTSLLSRTN